MGGDHLADEEGEGVLDVGVAHYFSFSMETASLGTNSKGSGSTGVKSLRAARYSTSLTAFSRGTQPHQIVASLLK